MRVNHAGLWVALGCMLATMGSAEDAPLNVFVGPKFKEPRAALYPRSEQIRGREGWVNVNFMIDPAGIPYEAVVTDSTGNEAFEKAALKAVAKWQFEPASINGVPIDAGYNQKIRFQLTGPGKGARREFVRTYKQLIQAISDQEKAAADALLASLDVENLYEDAFLHIAKFNYFRVWGDEPQRLAALTHAVAYESGPDYLPKKLYEFALTALFPMQVNAQDFVSALGTWYAIETHKIKVDRADELRRIVANIETLREDDRSYAVRGEIGGNSSWFFHLLKHRFEIVIDEGRLAEIKLRCREKYVFFRFEPNMRYTVADEATFCAIEAVGDPGTKFSLVQS